MATFKITNRFTGVAIFECEFSAEVAECEYSFRIGFAAKAAYAAKANLRDANLRDANLRGADLRGADLCGANLRGANLRGADLCGANLRGANLRDANLRGADLRGADLRGADLRGADLRGADLPPIKQDFLAEVLRLPNELEFLRAALVGGRVDGSTYEGECACLAGTLAKAAGVDNYHGTDIPAAPGIHFHASASSPRERFFAMIRKGDTPETNPACKIALDWTDEAIAVRDMIRATARAA